MARAVNTHGVHAKPMKASQVSPRSRRPRRAAQLAAAGAANVREPARIPMSTANRYIVTWPSVQFDHKGTRRRIVERLQEWYAGGSAIARSDASSTERQTPLAQHACYVMEWNWSATWLWCVTVGRTRKCNAGGNNTGAACTWPRCLMASYSVGRLLCCDYILAPRLLWLTSRSLGRTLLSASFLRTSSATGCRSVVQRTYFGTSSAGFRAKNPAGTNLNPMWVT